ncbi:AbrB/MazE/SpoVT family DNA-binding domain-containing protein [Acinetobacter puyangensis]|uniref:Antitoxin VapB n=1 Tax=Acinetobacter puyangensis TaxID=1096779 RepID=A0A240E856_9GAMM|nr:AbrB/MazE/SpoVT family DNA-binding domain-containing protein [Acinetobacter puyangensis]SNX44812.1 antitoxin VapB [Acinetobacter puyangensis]
MNSKVTRLFKNGSNQAVRIPKEMAFDSEQVRLYREGNKLIIEAVQPKAGLEQLLQSWQPLNEDFPEIEDLPFTTKGIFD